MAGHNVYVADSIKVHLCIFSKFVKKSFKTRSPRFAFENFKNDIKKIVEEYQIDIVIPVYEETLYLSKLKGLLPASCEIFCPSFELLDKLHNKYSFYELQKELGIDSLESYIIKRQEELKNIDYSSSYALKPSYSRGSFFLKHIYSDKDVPELKIEAKNPWIAQRWVDGKKYCSYSICRNGIVEAHSTYPSEIIGAGYCLSFESVHHEKILEWVKNLVQKTNYTGQISFDFVEESSGKLFAIECNPRATSGLHLMNEKKDLDRYFLQNNNDLYFPSINTKRKIGFGMMVYGWRNLNFFTFLKEFFGSKDVVFHKKDLKPFLFQIFYYINCFLKSFKYKMPTPIAYIYDLNWDEESLDN